MPATPMAQKPIYMAASAGSGGSPALCAISFGSMMLRTSQITRYSAVRAMPLGKLPARQHSTAHGSSTVPVPNTGSASMNAMTAESSRA